jgi:hypothetical protein
MARDERVPSTAMRGYVCRALFGLVLLSAPACVTTQILAEESSGQVGCPPEEIKITDKKDGAFNLVWKAECRGQTYFCTFGDPTACKQEAGTAEGAPPEPTATPDAAAPVAGGCQYDTQCKGERICEAGRCVEPTQRAVAPPAAEPPPAATTPTTTTPPVGPARPPK